MESTTTPSLLFITFLFVLHTIVGRTTVHVEVKEQFAEVPDVHNMSVSSNELWLSGLAAWKVLYSYLVLLWRRASTYFWLNEEGKISFLKESGSNQNLGTGVRRRGTSRS